MAKLRKRRTRGLRHSDTGLTIGLIPFQELMISRIKPAFVAAIALLLPAMSSAQRTTTDANCTYQTCALGLRPVMDGLAITRGVTERQVGVSSFFWPNDVAPLFAANDSAFEAATEAVRIRTIAAILTDAGIALFAAGVGRAAFQRDFDGLSVTLAGLGLASLGVSVPFQFAADGYLSRAVWWHNTRFAR